MLSCEPVRWTQARSVAAAFASSFGAENDALAPEAAPTRTTPRSPMSMTRAATEDGVAP